MSWYVGNLRERARREGRPTTGLLANLRLELRALNAFACYITQFPHLVAGPIIRYQDLEKQIHERSHTAQRFAQEQGIQLLTDAGLAQLLKH